MEFNKREVRIFFLSKQCDCGGNISDPFGIISGDSNKRIYSCQDCGKQHTINETETPRLVYQLDDIIIKEEEI